MCDLIDLNSPDVKVLLASPLIPTPENVESGKNEQPNRLMTEKRESPGNNPFDKALHETAEYVSKKGDPFEVMLQRAMKCKSKKNAGLKALDFMDDFTPKRKKRYLKTMNKTLDDSLIGDNMGLSNNNTTEDNNISPKQSHDMSIKDKSLLESSILNQSAMNDTLLEADYKHKKNSEIPILVEEHMSPKRFILPTSTSFKPLRPRHLSVQENRESSEKFYLDHKRSKSITNIPKEALQSDSSTMYTFLDRGFLESKQSEQSVFSTLSNVSSITRLNSISNVSSLPSADTTMNHAFLNSDSWKTNHEKINTTADSIEIKAMQYDLSDLVEKFNRVKCSIDRTSSVPNMKEEIDGSDSIKEENNEQITSDKLIDVDMFPPKTNFSKEHDKSTASTSSIDSVFIDNNKVDKKILDEAKVLAKTFEELTSDSESSIDDLISNNDEWMSMLVPSLEDEAVIDNLIEFSTSPKEDEKNIQESSMKQSPTSSDSAKDFLQETNSKFTDSVTTVKQTIVTTLLLDLKKLVKAENNPDAAKLIDNLENVLNTKCISNTELLATCLNISNELQTPITVDNKSNTEQPNKISIVQDQEKNEEVSSEENTCNRKTLPPISHKSDDTSQVVTSSTSSIKTSPCKDNSENSFNVTTSSEVALNNSRSKEKNEYSDEKLAMELLINLGKLLSGQTEDTISLQLLKNIGKTLNIASHNSKVQNESPTNHGKHNVKQATSLEIPKSRCDVSSSVSNKVVYEQSLSSKSKSPKKTRRSISAIHSPTKNVPNMQTYKSKDISESKGLKKRFSNGPGSINTVTNKKIAVPETCKTKKETAGFDNKKEKSLAMNDVKNKLKKKSDVVNKKGPMKAVHPINNMQKRVSLGRSTICSQVTTPPKCNKAISGSKIISSTPNSVHNSNCMPIKVAKSKPIASSTPDGQYSKISDTHLISADVSKKRNFSCDISPVTTYANNDSNDEQKGSPTRPTKLPTPQRSTPKRQQTETSGIPKYVTPPRKHSSSLDMNNRRSVSGFSQHLNRSFTGYQRYSPVCSKKNAEKILHSPLKDSNKIVTKVKPFNLISELKRHSISNISGKENNYI